MKKKQKIVQKRFVKNELFGLHTINTKNTEVLLITEGITDAISCIQNKFPTLSPVTNHVKAEDCEPIVKYAKRFGRTVIIFDNEDPKIDIKTGKSKINPDTNKPYKHGEGLRGAIVTAKMFYENGIKDVYIGILPEAYKIDGKVDINSYLTKFPIDMGKEKLQTIVDTSIHIISFLFNETKKEYIKITKTETPDDTKAHQKSKVIQKGLKEIIEFISKDDVSAINQLGKDAKKYFDFKAGEFKAFVKIVRKKKKEEEEEIADIIKTANKILEKYIILSPKEYIKDILVYDKRKGIYKEESIDILEKYMFEVLKEEGYLETLKDSEINSKLNVVKKYVKSYTYCSVKDFENNPRLKCILNGVLDFSDLNNIQLYPHDPKFKFRTQFPLHYNKRAKCPLIEETIKQVLEKDFVDLFYEHIGDTLTGQPWKYQKCLILYGEGQTGKSTLLNVITDFLGEQNTSTISLHDINNDEHATAELENTYANIFADLPSKYIQYVDKFKILIGDRELTINRKYGRLYKIPNHSKLFFSCNTIPKTGENTSAFFRRIHLVNCPNIIKEEDMDRDIYKKLSTKEELSGLLNKALEGLKRLEDNNGYDIKYDEGIEKTWETFSNPLLIFIETYIEYSNENSDEYLIEKEEFKHIYDQFLISKKMPITNMINLGRDVNNLREFKIETKRKQKDGVRKIYFNHVRFNQEVYEKFDILTLITEENITTTKNESLYNFLDE